jgi:hypothetical protein
MRIHINGINTLQESRKVNELQAVSIFLQNNIATATQAAKALNIHRPNLCRYKRTLEKSNQLAVVKKGYCPITKHKAGFLTTNPDLFPKSNQLQLF